MEPFDINMIKDNEIVLIIGNRGTGKTHICKQILKTKKYIKNGIVFDPTDYVSSVDKSYREIIKNELIIDEYNPKILENLVTYKDKHRDDYMFVVLDNCFFDKEDYENNIFRKLIFNSRFYKIFPIITLGCCYNFPYYYIQNIDTFFILKNKHERYLKSIYKLIMSNYFATYEYFIKVYNKCTCNGDCMVYDRVNNKLYRYIMSKK